MKINSSKKKRMEFLAGKVMEALDRMTETDILTSMEELNAGRVSEVVKAQHKIISAYNQWDENERIMIGEGEALV